MLFNDIMKAMLKMAIKQARQITDDQEALEVQALYKEWKAQIGRQLVAGEYVQHDGQLFKVLQTHVAQETFPPGVGTESLFMVIVKDHEGTLEDPIPFVTNMEICKDKYYTEDGVLYLGTVDTGIAVHHKLANLVGLYVVVVEQTGDEPVEPAGTKEDPIVYDKAATVLVKDLHYVDNGVVYLCVLNAGAPLHHDLSNLVGSYVQVAN